MDARWFIGESATTAQGRIRSSVDADGCFAIAPEEEGQKMPEPQDDNRRQLQGNPNEQDKSGKTPDSNTPRRGHGE